MVNDMKLREQQSLFALKEAQLRIKIYEMGYEVTLGDAYRDPRSPYGSKSSKHHRRLAMDLNLFKDGVYLTTTADHYGVGAVWESMGGVWGGRFNDGNHYEAPDNGEWIPHGPLVDKEDTSDQYVDPVNLPEEE